MLTTHKMKSVFQEGTASERMQVVRIVIILLDEYLPWLARRQFTGMTFTQKEDGWLIVLRAIRKSKREVSFFAGVTPEDAATVMVHNLLFGLARWKPDKWVSTRSDK